MQLNRYARFFGAAAGVALMFATLAYGERDLIWAAISAI